jgi:glutathione S-transferase
MLPPDGDYLNSDWFSFEKPKLLEKQPLVNLPYIIDGDLIITQSNACMAYLGRKVGLWGKTDKDMSECEVLLCEIYDFRNAVVGWSYPGGKPVEKFLELTKTKGALPKLENWLARSKCTETSVTTFLVGGYATAPDFHLFELLDQCMLMSTFHKLDKTFLDDERIPNLKRYYEKFRQQDKMQPYLTSKLHTAIGVNNLGAQFAGMPDGSAWVKNSERPADASGVY